MGMISKVMSKNNFVVSLLEIKLILLRRAEQMLKLFTSHGIRSILICNMYLTDNETM